MYSYYKNKKTNAEIFEESRQWAEKDLASGLLGRRMFGLIRSPDLLKEAYKEKGIDIRIIAGDCVFGDTVADADGYNLVMDAEIEKRFGPKVWEEIHERHLELRRLRTKNSWVYNL